MQIVIMAKGIYSQSLFQPVSLLRYWVVLNNYICTHKKGRTFRCSPFRYFQQRKTSNYAAFLAGAFFAGAALAATSLVASTASLLVSVTSF